MDERQGEEHGREAPREILSGEPDDGDVGSGVVVACDAVPVTEGSGGGVGPAGEDVERVVDGRSDGQ